MMFGWECPKCHAVMNPAKDNCINCDGIDQFIPEPIKSHQCIGEKCILCRNQINYDNNNENSENEDIIRWKALPIHEVTVNNRIRGCLSSLGIKTLGDLCQCSSFDLLNIPNFGMRSLKHVENILSAHKLKLSRGIPNDNNNQR